MKQTKLLIILDGWGHSEATENNAIAMADTPNWDYFINNHPHTLISTSGSSVGLPNGQMGNSEVGHLTIGSGRIIEQDFTRIQNDIDSGEFSKNAPLSAALNETSKNNKAVHIMGLLSDGGVHSHQTHIHAMLEMAHQKNCKKVFLHVFTDGRDTPPNSAGDFIATLEEKINTLKIGRIASVTGRFFAMDRDNRWERVSKAYHLLASGTSERQADSALNAIKMAYDSGESDEFIAPTIVGEPVTINGGDAVIFMNYRADRARELTQALTETEFTEFPRASYNRINFVCLTEYKEGFDLPCAYPPISINNTLGFYLSSLELTQLRIAETEKYAHVTFFFNGGVEALLPGEDRKLIPSPNVETYDLKPEMSAFELTSALLEAVKSEKYNFIVCNFANTDMVGHSGNLEATIKAVEAVDTCLGEIHKTCEENGAEILITADHGNAEQMMSPKTNKSHTAHTTNPVPLVYLGHRKASIARPLVGTLTDLAPTILTLMDIKQPKEMTGNCLLTLK